MDYVYTFENIEPTDKQRWQLENNFESGVKLFNNNIKQILEYMKLTPDLKDVMYTYLTGKGKWADYSPAYLKREFGLEPEIKEYKRLSRIYHKDLVRKMWEEIWAAREKAENEAFEAYRNQAREIINSGNVEELAKILKERDTYMGEFYKDMR